MNRDEFVSVISSVRPSATFLTIHGYRAESGEVADHQIVFHVSYRNLLWRSIVALTGIEVSEEIEVEAKSQLLNSLNASLAKVDSTSVEDLDDAYERFFENDGTHIRGIKRHIATDVFHLYGVTVQKRIHTPGTFKEVKSKSLTIAKNRLSAMLPVSKWRQYRITPGQVDRVTVDSRSILPPDWR